MATETFVIVGGGLAAARAVEGMRDAGHEGPIVVLSRESHLPYERPPLSKEVLQGKKPEDSAAAQPKEWYAEHHVTLRLGAEVTAIDPAAHMVTLADGGHQAYDRLLLVTGSAIRPLDVPGADRPEVHYLRTVEDSVAIRDRLGKGVRVVVVGAGWIGLEVAAAARLAEAEVTVVEPQATPLNAVVGPEVGRWFADLHEGHGVTFRFGDGVEAFEPEDDGVTVVTTRGARLLADLVVVGVGIRPETGLAEAAGLTVDDGVVTDAALRTSDSSIWAAGDVANAHNPRYRRRIRVEHWANARNQGYAAGQSMAGKSVEFDNIPYFYSDQYDAGLEYSGYVPRGTDTDVVLRGDPGKGSFMAFWLDADGHVLAGMHVNEWDTIDGVKALIDAGRPVDRTRLADASVALEEVLAGEP
jgi:3-phenylpropionate/trans-cinnamate dioxygenase ferredoxin reductase subunit